VLALKSFCKYYAHLGWVPKDRCEAATAAGSTVLVAGANGPDCLLSFFNIPVFPNFKAAKPREVFVCLNKNRPEAKLDLTLPRLVRKHPVLLALADEVRVHRLGVRSIKALYLHFFEEFYDIGHALCSPNPEQRVVLEFLVHVDKKLEGLHKLAYHLGEFLVVTD
jgi:hypothetical protein